MEVVVKSCCADLFNQLINQSINTWNLNIFMNLFTEIQINSILFSSENNWCNTYAVYTFTHHYLTSEVALEGQALA